MTTDEKKPQETGPDTPIERPRFEPTELKNSPSLVGLPDELWQTILQAPCTFPADIFTGVMLNLIKNPNITSSHLFRADIFYDSGDHADCKENSTDLAKHLKPEYQPISNKTPDGFECTRTIVRQLIPRNPQLDRPLVQTCHIFQRSNDTEEENIVLYIPHVAKVEDMPFYHPEVARLAFQHRWQHTPSSDQAQQGSISVSYHLFPESKLTIKLERTALRLLQTIHKHGQGQLAGYEKRVHLDQIIPQKQYQDTYARLKATYGKKLAEQWVEVTDPGKHVFEDIGIAAFLVELWREMYAPLSNESDTKSNKPPFPGFVDIGCGNGLLTHILLSEGYPGWGFDARQRKTWSIFPPEIQAKLEQRILIPSAFLSNNESSETNQPETPLYHNGHFTPGTFIVSNHADELTPWTPLLAHLNQSAFIAIPCCSHDLAGSRFRAPATTKANKPNTATTSTPPAKSTSEDKATTNPQAAESGSLARTPAQKKMPSAYSTLCSYVSSLAQEVGFEPEDEVLRIPSTRNRCVVGRKFTASQNDVKTPEGFVREIVERELGKSCSVVGEEWIERAEKLAKKPGSGH